MKLSFLKTSSFLLFFLFIGITYGYSQVKPIPIEIQQDKQNLLNSKRNRLNDTLRRGNNSRVKVKLSAQTKYTDYKIINYNKDTSYVDTTLTIQKAYKFNFLRKDQFELLPFHNIGQQFNKLAYTFDKQSLYPDIGYRAKQFFYKEVEDINYYQVPTPTSEIMFLTTLEQGQFLESFYTLNFNKRFNASIAYTGLRSLGKYRRSLVSQGIFRTTMSYTSPKEQYAIRGHIITHDILSEESGGLTSEALTSFVEEDENFEDRGRLDVNLTNAENLLKGVRMFFEHDYKLLSSKRDSVSSSNFSNLKIGHQFLIEKKYYEFNQDAPNTSFFGSSGTTGKINDRVDHSYFKNQFFLEFNSKYVLGRFKVKSDLISYKYGYDELINLNAPITKNQLKGTAASFGAEWKAQVKQFQLNADGSIISGNGRLGGTNLAGQLSYKKDSLFNIKAGLTLNSKSPNFNFLLHQSSYDDYNWENSFENVRTQNINFRFLSKWVNVSADFTNIENYTYFGADNLPYQSSENITYLKVKASKEIRYWKLAFDNTIMYQNVSSGSTVFRVPDLVTRNTLYYSDYWFKGNPLKVHIGATFKYFTKYKANAYNPLLAEFTLQDTEEIGYPMLDVFFNAQVRRTRIYFKIDNVLSNYRQKDYFAAPNYPYRDFVIRFGLVWNWFI